MGNKLSIQFLFGVAMTLGIVACSTDAEPAAETVNRPLLVSNVTFSSWDGAATRAATYPDATNKEIWVSANDATPSLYAMSTVTDTSDPTYNKYVVKVGNAQEWSGVSANVYGFFTSSNASRVNAVFTIAEVQDGTDVYDFQASEKKLFTWSTQNSDGVILALRQQLARVNITVEDGDANTQIQMGNGQLYCQGMFQYTAPATGAPQFHTSEGYWAFAGETKTITLNNPANGNGRSFTAYILPQTVATASHFFHVYNTVTGRSSYYALPNANYSLQEGYQYNCTLMQNMYVASISVDEDFANGEVNSVTTTAESY